MKIALANPRSSGSTLVESSIAMGILAVAIPLVFGSMVEAEKISSSADTENRSAWIIAACLQEVENSRVGKPQYFAPTEVGQIFPPEEEIWALAFSNEGSCMGKVSIAPYENGIRYLNGKTISHLATISAIKREEDGELLTLRITLEHPAAAPLEKRKSLDFHSQIP